MRVAIDTNVLVRYLTADDSRQFAVAKAAIEGPDSLVIPTVVLCELVWVLRSLYRHARADIATTLRKLVRVSNVEVDLDAAEAGLGMLMHGGDFADGVIEHEATRASCDRLITFDQDFARTAASSRVVLLPTS